MYLAVSDLLYLGLANHALGKDFEDRLFRLAERDDCQLTDVEPQ